MNVTLDLPGLELLRRSRGPTLRTQIERERHVLMQVAGGRPLPDVLHDLLSDIEARAGRGVMASILELSADGKQLNHLAGPSLPPAYLAAIDGTIVGEGVGSCGTVVHRDAPVYVSDIAVDPLWKDYCKLALDNNLRACWSTPIKGMDGETLGTFAIYYDAPRSPRPRDLEAIAAVTLTVALAIERHRADLELRRVRDEVSALKARLKR